MASIVKNVVQRVSRTQTATPPNDLCEICGKKPKFVEKGFKHPYCTRSCARNGGIGPSPTACTLHGCRATGKPAFANFCTEAHAKEGVRLGQVPGCDHCGIQPQIVGNLCIPCDRRARSTGTRLKELRSDSATFKSLRVQFLSEWESTAGVTPIVEKVLEVTVPRDVRQRHENYRTRNPKSEEIRSFHSSQVICDLGYKDTALCDFKSCGICKIIKTSFKSLAFDLQFNTGRFGEGIYSYRNPALADRFATSCTSSPYRVTIACDMIVEKGQAAEVALIDEEKSLFVPVYDAILPVYVIMYTT